MLLPTHLSPRGMVTHNFSLFSCSALLLLSLPHYSNQYNMQMRLFLVIALVFAVVHAANITVQVGLNGNNFSPKNVTASIGDTIQYDAPSFCTSSSPTTPLLQLFLYPLSLLQHSIPSQPFSLDSSKSFFSIILQSFFTSLHPNRWVWVSYNHNVVSGNPCTGDGKFRSGSPNNPGTTFNYTVTAAGLLFLLSAFSLPSLHILLLSSWRTSFPLPYSYMNVGIINYFCEPHCSGGMVGTIIVKSMEEMRGACEGEVKGGK